MNTITYATREEWLADRPNRIGASESPGILGAGYAGESAFNTYVKKVEPTLDEVIDATERERREVGLEQEPTIRRLFTKRTGMEVHYDDPERPRVYVSDDRPHLGTTLDGRVYDNDGLAPLEVKNVGEYVACDWDNDSVPLRVLIQVQHQMYVTKTERAYVAALLGGNRFVSKPVERDQRFIDAMLPVLDDFWDHVQRKEPPAVDGSKATAAALMRLYRFDSGEENTLPAEASEWDEDVVAAKSAIKAAESMRREAENKIKAAIGDATFGVLPHGGRYSWKTSERNDPPRKTRYKPGLAPVGFV